MKAIIMAGGKGTRAASIAADIPKPMIQVCGKTILEYQLECLKRNDINDIIIVTGHLGEKIKNYFSDGKCFNCNITYYTETEPLGTAGALYKIAELDDDFILLNGDIIFDIDFSRIISFHQSHNALATLAVHPNSHPFDSALILTDHECRVTGWLNKEDERLYYKNQVNSGIHILSKRLLDTFKFDKEKIDLDRDILKPSINSNRIYAYSTPEYIKDMGTPARYDQVVRDIKNGIVQKRNLSQKQTAVFLDRDGTLNILNDFVKKPEDLLLIDGAAEAVQNINKKGYLAIVITNQPVIARGDVSIEELEIIHQKLETELGKAGAYIDDLFYCPHHPDKGFAGERPEYKIDCSCRKPKPGLIFHAAEKYNINLAKSYMAGDDDRDVQAAKNAGCIPVYLANNSSHKNYENNIIVFKNLLDFSLSLPE
jgi:D,D-heptose 1,7-bisphosphate phosphatase